MSNTRVFVSNIPYRTTWQNLRNHFSAAGNVTFAKIFMNPENRMSRGMGFVEYENEEDAQNAIQQFNETEFEGRTIYVREFVDKRAEQQQQEYE